MRTQWSKLEETEVKNQKVLIGRARVHRTQFKTDSFVLFIWGRQTDLSCAVIIESRNIDGLREVAHPDVDAVHGFIDAGGIECVIAISFCQNIESLFNVMNMMIAGNSEIKNLFPKDSANPSRERSTLPIDQAIEWTKARVHVNSDPVLCMWKTLDPEDADKRRKGHVSTLQMFHPFRELQWRADCIRVEDFPRNHSFGTSPKNSKRPWRTTHQIWKFPWSSNLHVHVQRHRFGQEGGLLHYQFEKNYKCMRQDSLTDTGYSWVPEKKASGIKDRQSIVANGNSVLRASPIRWVEEFENSGKVEILSTSVESLTTLIFFSELSLWWISSVFTEQSQSCAESSQRQILERQVKLDQKVLEEHPEKFRSSRKNSSHWLIFRDYRLLRETECFRTWRISNRCLPWAKLNLFEQLQNSSIQSR